MYGNRLNKLPVKTDQTVQHSKLIIFIEINIYSLFCLLQCMEESSYIIYI